MPDLRGYAILELVRHDRRHLVRRARRLSDGRSVVVKSASGVVPGARAIAALRHEWEILRELHCPGIVRVAALERHGSGLALITYDAGSRNLADYLAGGLPSIGRFLDWAVEIAEALGRLHDARCIHRDINPSNLVLDETERHVTLVDFELATTLVVLETEAQSPAEFEGTLPYLSPEQTGRTGRSVDARTDFYALGATLYEMLTGAPPFVSEDALEVIHAHLARRPVPPSQRDPRVPTLLSDLVNKLLAKTPEERYQGADALLADLREARDRWTRTGTMEPFPLARRDVPRELRIPDELYGRSTEVRVLTDAFARVVEGGRELVLITGEPGIGKSALVRRIDPSMTARRGLFASGKFDQLERAEPYAGLIEAFRGLVRRLLAEEERVLAGFRQRLAEAVGPNGGVLTAVLPEIELVLGPQPEAPAIDPAETANRFFGVFQRFVRAFAREESPLVLFLDDLHWIDRASLGLLEQILSDPSLRHLLVVGTYRESEVGRGHPLALAIGALQGAEIAVHTVHLGPLTTLDVAKLCADMFASDVQRVGALAELIVRKTAGNPFFARRLLHMLHAEGWLRFEGEWVWDTAEIEAAAVSDNVVDLMVRSIERLPAACRELIGVAACVGRVVDLAVLAAVSGRSRPATLDALFPALDEGLLLPLRDAYKMPRQEGPLDEPIAEIDAFYRFAHDRVQEAALSRLDDARQRCAHLAIGRRLLELPQERIDERLFDIVDHLNRGAALIHDPAKRRCLSELNLRAGRKAKASGAHRAALDYVTAAASLLPEDAWTAHPALAFAIGRDRAECAYLSGEHALSDALVDDALAHAPSRADALDLWDLRVMALAVAGDYVGAIARGREALALVDEALPLDDDVARATQAERETVARALGGRPVEALLDLPPMHREDELATMRLLVDLIFPAYVREAPLFTFLAARTAALSAEQGHSAHAPYVFALYGVSYGVETGDWATASSFGQLGVALGRRLGNPAELCRALQALGHYEGWRVPRRVSASTLREAIRLGLEAGDLRWTAYAATSLSEVLFSIGAPLSEVIDEVERGLPLCIQQKNRLAIDRQVAVRQASRSLLGRTRSWSSFDDADFEEARFVREAAPISLGLYEIVRLQCANVFGDVERARRLAETSTAYLPFLGAYLARANHAFHAALAYAASCDAAPAAERAVWLDKVRAEEAKLAAWAEGCPENFGHLRDLVRAELARLAGDPWAPERLYERAIEGAREQGFVQDEALAEELAARFHLAHGWRRVGRMHLEAALEAFARWGATAKVDALQRAYPELLLDVEFSGPSTLPTTKTSSISEPSIVFDAVSLVKATQAISSEMVREKLLEKLLRIVLESAGAERGALLLEEEGALAVCARATLEGGVSLERTPMTGEWPPSVIHYVFRTGEPVMLTDAQAEGPFMDDACVRSRGIRSVLCVPVRRHAQAVGLVYLENNVTPHAFTRARIEMVRHLAAQAAISLENARLYQLSQEAVRLRDDFLLIASHELRTPLTSMQVQSQRISRLVASQGRDPREIVQRIRSAVDVFARQIDGLSRLAEAMLDVSRIEAGQLVPVLAEVDLAALIRDLAVRMMEGLDRAGSRLELDLDESIVGCWDSNRIEQVLVHLLSNAMKFGAGHPITIRLRGIGEQAHIEVQDRGPGVPPDKREELFQRFGRLTSPMHYGGLGLGLYISRRIVEAHGGTIGLCGDSGPGATFFVDLPCHAKGGADVPA